MVKTVLDQERLKAILIALVVPRLRVIGKMIPIAQTTYQEKNGVAKEVNPCDNK
jgi:hypothetical protein